MLCRALLDECADRPLEQVSVSALVRRAGVSRATFYLHYGNPHCTTPSSMPD